MEVLCSVFFIGLGECSAGCCAFAGEEERIGGVAVVERAREDRVCVIDEREGAVLTQ